MKSIPPLKIIKLLYQKLIFKSNYYWERRYENGGNSGAGSYFEVAAYKADIINELIKEFRIKKLLDFGCGDGNQAKYFNIQEYWGTDISKKSIEICRNKFSNDNSKSFFVYDKKEFNLKVKEINPDLIISLDVFYHLVENSVYWNYLKDLFGSCGNYIVVFSTNFNCSKNSLHHRDRYFTKDIEEHFKNWQLAKIIETPIKGEHTLSDFYIYNKIRQI